MNLLDKKSQNPTIIFENEYLLAINKPAGLVVHKDGKTEEPALTDWILKERPEIAGVGEPLTINKGTSKEQIIDRPGIVHRLDRDTSGIMIIAKTQESYIDLKKQFQEREIQKTYRAFVWGIVKEDNGTINRPIGRSKSDFRKWSAERFARGELREAITDFKVLKRIPASSKILKDLEQDIENADPKADQKKETPAQKKIPHEYTYIEAMPKTGRTHQIRVHMKAVNHPIVGDSLYAPNHPEVLGFNRVALHAFKVEVNDLAGKRHEFEAPMPEDFLRVLEWLG